MRSGWAGTQAAAAVDHHDDVAQAWVRDAAACMAAPDIVATALCLPLTLFLRPVARRNRISCNGDVITDRAITRC